MRTVLYAAAFTAAALIAIHYLARLLAWLSRRTRK